MQSRERGAKGWIPAITTEQGNGAQNPIPGLPADGGWHEASLHGSFSAVDAQLRCRGGRRTQSHRARPCRRTRRPFVFARGFRFTLTDSSPPEISGSSGSLFAGGTRAGTQSVVVTASDRGGGLSQLFLRVNGNATAVHDYRCQLSELAGGVVADTLSPCPNRDSQTLTTNANTAPFLPGANAVQVCARDYSDSSLLGEPPNTTCSKVQTVTANGGCDKVAATGGSDSSPGSPASPYSSAQKLADSLSSGQTGCMRSGTFAANDTIEVTRPGITLTSFPGERATLRGELKLEKTANGVTVRNLNLDGRSSYKIGPVVFASNDTFDNDDVTNYNTGICFILGAANPSDGRAINTVIENSRIHNCGVLPAQNGDHGIYVEHATGTLIHDNWIYDNADRGIQLYPDSQGARIYRNVIDGNGEGIIVSDGSSNNVIYQNVISNSKVRWNIESSDLTGTGNAAAYNCLRAGNSNSFYDSGGGAQSGNNSRNLNIAGNLVADPLFMSRATKDFRLQAASPCAFIYG